VKAQKGVSSFRFYVSAKPESAGAALFGNSAAASFAET